MLVFYGLIAGTLLKMLDALMAMYPSNPYVLTILTASAGQLIGWTRGDIGTFSIHIIAGVIAVWLLVRLLRLLFGTQIVVSHEYQYANSVYK